MSEGQINAVIPAARRADWYARRVGVAAAREIKKIPAARRPTNESRFRAAPAGSAAGDAWVVWESGTTSRIPVYAAAWQRLSVSFPGS